MLACPGAVSLVPFSIKTLKVLSRTSLFKCIYTLIKLPWWHSSKESACNAGAAGDRSSIPGLGRSPGGGHGNPVQYSCLQNPMDRGAWQATVHGVTKSRTWLKQLSIHASTCWQSSKFCLQPGPHTITLDPYVQQPIGHLHWMTHRDLKFNVPKPLLPPKTCLDPIRENTPSVPIHA